MQDIKKRKRCEKQKSFTYIVYHYPDYTDEYNHMCCCLLKKQQRNIQIKLNDVPVAIALCGLNFTLIRSYSLLTVHVFFVHCTCRSILKPISILTSIMSQITMQRPTRHCMDAQAELDLDYEQSLLSGLILVLVRLVIFNFSKQFGFQFPILFRL